MPTIELGYGRSSISFDYDIARFDVLGPGEEASHPLSDVEIGAALDAPIDSRPLEEVVTADDSVLIVVSDATRATGSAQIVNLLVRRLREYIAPSVPAKNQNCSRPSSRNVFAPSITTLIIRRN